MSLADRAWAHAEQTRILRRFNALMQDFDVILLPTAPVSPFPWTQGHAAEIEGQSMDIYYRWLALTYRGSLAGGPSITLPCGRDPHGMPFGLQVLGAVRSDEALLATAKSLETLFAGNPDMARPCPDMTSLTPSDIDLTFNRNTPADHGPKCSIQDGTPRNGSLASCTLFRSSSFSC